MTCKIEAVTDSPDEVLETAILNLYHLRLVEQQAWLDQMPYKDVEQELVVRDAHAQLSEPARDILGLVLHYPDEVEELLNTLPAPNSSYIRKGTQRQPFNRGRVVTLARKRWDMSIRDGQRVVQELVNFIATLASKPYGVRPKDYLK
jgi:hypothetical protein